MLYNLLKFTIDEYNPMWFIDIGLMEIRYDNSKELIELLNKVELIDILKDNSSKIPENMHTQCKKLKKIIGSNEFKSIKEAIEIIYDPKWTEYLYYVDEEDRYKIIRWFNFISQVEWKPCRTVVMEYREDILLLLKKLNHKNYEIKSMHEIFLECAKDRLEIEKEI